MKYTITQSRILYIYQIEDRAHKGLLKIGEVFVDNEVADRPTKAELATAVKQVLEDVDNEGKPMRPYIFKEHKGYEIVHVECTTYAQTTKCYKADDVYRTLREQNIPFKAFAKIDEKDADIWTSATLNEILEAIRSIKDGHKAGYGPIVFRPEQRKAIDDTVAHFHKVKGKAFLWNAKMRFGKTLSGLQVAKEMEYSSTLIITHRPVVDKGWSDDFKKIFGNDSRYVYATRMSDNDATGGDFYSLTRKVKDGTKRLVFFVSMQYLRLSKFVGGKEKHEDPLKRAIMEYDWDFVMVDEAHEGIDAAAGIRVMKKLEKDKTRILSLSGTPFNLLEKYEKGEIYTWDYVMEQNAKQKWDRLHYGDPNPYADLPRMQILTFHLDKLVRNEAIENNEVFKFHEFFRVWTENDKHELQAMADKEDNPIRKAELQGKADSVIPDKFVHEAAIKDFLNKLVEESETSQYPFSTDEFRENFRHTFWLLPGVKEAAALEELLHKHDVFGDDNEMFHIINAAGDGNIEDKDGSALAEVENHIRGNAEKNITKKDYTITLSCGKLTTGVSVPEWTAVLCMKGSENTPAANYMQTIFRVQTHAVLNGRQKSDCYVFDFAPDRALTAVAETAKMAVYAATDKGKGQLKLSQKKEEEHLESFIRLCPVLSMDEGKMGQAISANQIFEKLSNVYIERAVRSGYADNSLYNPERLMNLTPEQAKALGDVRDLLGSMPSSWKPEKIDINDNGIGDNKDAELVKYIYCLKSDEAVPARPHISEIFDEEGRPTTDDPEWDEQICYPSQMFKYLFVSHTKKVQGEWTDFSEPVLWREWVDPESKNDPDKKKRDEENKEKRARMSVLRGVSIRIPLIVYGAEINDDKGEEITIDNFTDLVDDLSWEEYMPKGFTKETFNILKDCFDRNIFTGAAKRIRAMVKEADTLNTEDRINKIATIFSYFHNPDKETVLTPWRVVNMHMSDCLGGWCFLNEMFDDNHTVENEYHEFVNAARFVDRGDVTRNIFADYNARILEINSKTGLYPLYMAYSMFRGVKEPAFREIALTGERGKSTTAKQYDSQADNDREIWKDVLQDNIFVVCRTKMAVSITKRTLAGFRKIRMNVKCYEREVPVNDLISGGVLKRDTEGVTKEGDTYSFNGSTSCNCDLITVLRAKPELFHKDVASGEDYWHVYNAIPKKKNEDINNMKFTAIVGNPPYQMMDGGTHNGAMPVYNQFVDSCKKLSPAFNSLIMPSRWFAGGRGLDDFRDDMLNDDRLRVLHDFIDSKQLFKTADIAGGICYYLWDNNYHGDCCVSTHSGNTISTITRKLNEHGIFVRDNIGLEIVKKIQELQDEFMDKGVLQLAPFGLRTFVRGEDLPFENSVKVLSSAGEGYVSIDDITRNADKMYKYKVIIGRLVPSNGEVGIDPAKGYKAITCPQVVLNDEVVTETYLVCATLDTYEEAVNCAEYLKLKFPRFLLRLTYSSMNVNRANFIFVPKMDFKFSYTDTQLYNRFNLSAAEREYIEKTIRVME